MLADDHLEFQGINKSDHEMIAYSLEEFVNPKGDYGSYVTLFRVLLKSISNNLRLQIKLNRRLSILVYFHSKYGRMA